VLNPQAVNQLLALYAWFPLAASLLILLLIARFYEKFSGRKMYFRAFFLPVVLFGAAEVRYAYVGRIVGDMLGDLALTGAGLSLLILCGIIYVRMLSPASYQTAEDERQNEPRSHPSSAPHPTPSLSPIPLSETNDNYDPSSQQDSPS
jgi:hypothetical protein